MTRSVSAEGNIERSVVLTGDRNHVSLSFGGDFLLPLDRRQIPAPQRPRRDKGYNPLPLLAPDADKLPLIGRDAILGALRAWCDSDADVSVHTLIARAGTGKTRLAIELCKVIDGAPKPNASEWLAGFIRPSDLAGVIDKLATQSFDWKRSTLLVIDYAAAAHREIARWLDRLAGEPFAGKLRLLLLDREAPEGFGWWNDLTRPTEQRATTRRDLFVDPDRPQSLPDLEKGEGRRALLEAALAATNALMGEKAPGHSLPAPGVDKTFDSALLDTRFGNALNLAMAGLIAAEQGPVAALALRRLDAARNLARHELGRMARIATGEGISVPGMQHALGFNGLAGGLAIASIQETIATELTVAGVPDTSGRLADVLMQELPQSGDATGKASEPRLGTMQPDLIGEAVIVEALLVGAPNRALAAAKIVERAYRLAGARAAEALMRLIQDYGYAAEDSDASEEERGVARVVIGLLSALAEAIPDDEIESLETLVSAFPENTIILREAAAAQTQRLVDIWRTAGDAVDHDLACYRSALWLTNLSIRLSAIGRLEEALTAAQEAVSLRRALASGHPEMFKRELASSLNNLATRLAHLGQSEAAVTAAQEGIDLRRALAILDPDTVVPELARGLANLSHHLSNVGDNEAALDAAKEAVGYFRGLAEKRSEEFSPSLAMALSTLSVRLSGLGEDELALAAAQESVDLRRALAAVSPDAFTPALAGSINNLSNRLSAVNQPEAALAAAQEAVDLRRALAAVRPDVFNVDLAGSLGNLSARLAALDRHPEALAASSEGVDLYRPLAVARPAAIAPKFAMSLSVLGDRLEGVGRIEEAVRADCEAIATLSPHFLAQPNVFTKPMHAYCRDYIRRAGLIEIVPDPILLRPILAILNNAEKA
ncbi:MAG: tetratricopeptide repeat protein [Pseudomonadota bacterium]